MPLDSKKLHQDALRLQKARQVGTTKAVRDALPVIRELRKKEVSWAAIAQALAEQGVVQGKDRIPLTTSRLTALVSQIEALERKKALKFGDRDRADTTARPVRPAHRLTLSADLIRPAGTSDFQRPSTEDELRQAAFEKLQTVLKKE